MLDTLFKVLVLTPTDDGQGAPAMFWGPPGVGKTKKIKRACAELGMPLIVLSPGLQGEGAFGVTPVPHGEGKGMRIGYPAPDWVELFEDAGDVGLVFVDEITTAPPAMQPPLLGLIQERRVGNHYLGSRVRVLGAGNPPAQAAAGYDLAPPVANRMGHFDWTAPSQAEWSDYMLAKSGGKKIDAPKALAELEATEKRIADAWAGPYAKAQGLITSFLARRPALLHAMPNAGDPAGSRAWPSHRTWDLTTNVVTTAEILGCSEVEIDALVAGFVGQSAATEFVAFKATADLPDPEALLDGKVRWEHDPDRLDRSMAVLSACAALVAPEQAKDRAKRAEALWTLLGTCMNGAFDCAVPAARVLARAKLGGVKTAMPVLVKLRPVLDAAGIKPGP